MESLALCSEWSDDPKLSSHILLRSLGFGILGKQ